VKYFALSKANRELEQAGTSAIKHVLVHTGQHYDYSMSKIFFDELGIEEPAYHLDVGSGTHGEQTARIIQRVEETLVKVKPAIMVVYGDTNSTLGGALAAAKMNIPICHVEAGLRSYNKAMPEEINRVLADHLSTVLLCPSSTAVVSLQKEGFKSVVESGKLVSLKDIERAVSPAMVNMDHPLVANVGDVMYDVLLHASAIALQRSTILQRLSLTPKKYYLLTLHRAENTDDPRVFKEIVQFINTVAKGTTVIFPMHPRTKNVYARSETKFDSNVRIVEPAGYFDLLALLKNSSVLLTDSGGMQKEAFWLRTQCITLRNETEWVETLDGGWNTLYKNFKGISPPSSTQPPVYGDGRAAEKILAILLKLLRA
jgi:UDP-N-acetylglucosamine 2-epimerase